LIYTLAADGPSDIVLTPILTWSLKQASAGPVMPQWADFSRIPSCRGLEDRLRAAVELYPCDVLFVHRDSEGQEPALRRNEIAGALRQIRIRHIPVVPVRMTEAWLLADEMAIRSAAGNPNGREELNLPDIRRLEDVPDPKRVLRDALTRATGLNARRRSSFPVSRRVRMIANYVDDYSGLNVLPAFRALQQDIRAFVTSLK